MGKNGVKIAVLLIYLSNFRRSLEMPLINCKFELLLKLMEKCELTIAATGAAGNVTGVDSASFKKTDTKLFYIVLATLSTEDSAKVAKQQSEGFKKLIIKLYDSSYQGVKRLFVLAYKDTASNNKVSVDSFKKYSLPRIKIAKYNIEIDGRNLYD